MRKSSALTIVGFVVSVVPGWSVALRQHRLLASQPVEAESQAESDGTQKALEFGKDWFSKVLHETAKYGSNDTLITALQNITNTQIDIIPKLFAAKAKMEVLRKLVFGDADSLDTAEGSIQHLLKELTSQLQSARKELKELQVKVSQSTSGRGRQMQLRMVEEVLKQTTESIKSKGKQQWELLQPESRGLLNKMKSVQNALDWQKKAAAWEHKQGKMLWVKHAKELRSDMADEVYKLWDEVTDLSKRFAEESWRVEELTDEEAKAEVPKVKKSLADAKALFKGKWDQFLSEVNASNPAARAKFEENMQFFEALYPNMSVTQAKLEHIKDQMRSSTDRQRIEVLHGCRLATDHLNELIAVVEAVKKQPRDVRLTSALAKQTEAVRLMDEALANTTRKLEEMHKTALKRGDPQLVRDFETADYEFHVLNETVNKQEAQARKAFFRLADVTRAAIAGDKVQAAKRSADQARLLKESINELVMGGNVNRTIWESKLNELKDLMVPTESELKSTQKQIKGKAELLKKLWQKGGTVYDWALGAQKKLRPILERLNESRTNAQAKAPQAPKPEVEVPNAEVKEASNPPEAPVAETPESQAEEVSPENKEAQPPAEMPAPEADEVSAQPEGGSQALEVEAPKAEVADAQAEDTETTAEVPVAEVPESQAEQIMPPAEAPVAEVPKSQAAEVGSQAEEAKPLDEAPVADAPESQAEEVSPSSEAEEAKPAAEAPVADAPESQAEEVSPEAKASQAEAASSEAEEAKPVAEAPVADAPESQAEEVSPEAKASQAEAASSESEEVNSQPADVPEEQAQPADSQAEEVSQAGEAEAPTPQAEEAPAPQAEEAPASAEEAPASQAEEAPASAEEAPASQAEEAAAPQTEEAISASEEGGEAPQE